MTEIKKIRPNQRTKGYKDSYLGGWDKNGVIYSRLFNIAEDKVSTYVSGVDHELIRTIIKNVKEISGGRVPEQGDFLPKGFEEEEARTLSDFDLLRYVLYRYRYNIFPLKKELGDYPPCVQIEPTSVCNFRCVMCYQVDKSFSDKSNGHMGMMELDLYKKIIDELEGNVEAITLASRGEPLLHPQIKQILAYTGQKFLGFKLNTNASLLTEDMCHSLLQSGLKTLVFSIDAADKETYEKIRVNGKFDVIDRNVKRFDKIKREEYSDSTLQTKVSGVMLSKADQKLNEMVVFWKDRVDDVAFVHYNPWESSYENEVKDLIVPCTELWRRLFVWQDGRVNPCDYDYKTTIFSGQQPNALNSTIKEIWRSPVYEELRRKHLNSQRGMIEPCNRCVSC